MKRIKSLLFIIFFIISFYNKDIYAESAIQKHQYNYCFEQAAMRYGVNVKLLYAIAKVESDFNPYAINVNANGRSIKEYYPENKYQAKMVLDYLLSHGYNFDVGIAQINIVNIKRWGLDPYSLLDPCYNLDVSARLLKNLIDRYGLNWQAIWHYNGRPSYAYKVYHALIWLQNHDIYATSYRNP